MMAAVTLTRWRLHSISTFVTQYSFFQLQGMWETLSLEIIFEIFGHFLPGLKLSITEPHQFPWYLGQVCMTWRNAFLTFPQLWSTLDIDLEYSFRVDHTILDHRLAMLEESLLRSGNHTISFTFISVLRAVYSSPPTPSRDVLCCSQMLDRLVAQSTRWRDAYFTLHDSEIETLYRVKNCLPMLRSLQFRFVRSGNKFYMQDFNDLVVDAPRLTRIYFNDTKKWNIDWSSMTSVHFKLISEWDITYFLSCLKHAHRLEELVVRYPIKLPSSPDTIRPITLPSLKVLEVGGLGPLLLFETPALEELYASYGVSENIRYEWITSSYIGSLRHLRKLSIYPWNDMELKDLIQILPAPQDLYVKSNDPNLLELLPACGKACEVKTLTLALRCLTRHEDLLRIITGWKKQGHTVAGFGPFSNLTKISVIFLKELEARVMVDAPPQDVLDSLKHHFEDQGIQYSIQQSDAYTTGVHVSSFDTIHCDPELL